LRGSIAAATPSAARTSHLRSPRFSGCDGGCGRKCRPVMLHVCLATAGMCRGTRRQAVCLATTGVRRGTRRQGAARARHALRVALPGNHRLQVPGRALLDAAPAVPAPGRGARRGNRIQLILFGMQNRTCRPYLAANNRILISLVRRCTFQAQRLAATQESLDACRGIGFVALICESLHPSCGTQIKEAPSPAVRRAALWLLPVVPMGSCPSAFL
jgi:hypothetical protein